MKIRWAWFDGAQTLALGVFPPVGFVRDDSFYAPGEDTVCAPAVRVCLPGHLAAWDVNRRAAVVDPLVLTVNALLVMGLDQSKDAVAPTVTLQGLMAVASGSGAGGCALGSRAGVSLPSTFEPDDDDMATLTIDALHRLLYALRHART